MWILIDCRDGMSRFDYERWFWYLLYLTSRFSDLIFAWALCISSTRTEKQGVDEQNFIPIVSLT